MLGTVTDHDKAMEAKNSSSFHLVLIIFNSKKKKKLIDSNDSNSIYFEPNMAKLSNCGGSFSSQIENA